jgi:hypothetical protein
MKKFFREPCLGVEDDGFEFYPSFAKEHVWGKRARPW